MEQTIAQLTIAGVGALRLGFTQENAGQLEPGDGGTEAPTTGPGYTVLTVHPLEGEPVDVNVSEAAGRQILDELRTNGGQPFIFGAFGKWYRVGLENKRHPGSFILHGNGEPQPDTTNVVGLATHWDIFEVASPFEEPSTEPEPSSTE